MINKDRVMSRDSKQRSHALNKQNLSEETQNVGQEQIINIAKIRARSRGLRSSKQGSLEQ